MGDLGTPHPRPVGRREVAVPPRPSGSGGRTVRFHLLHGLRHDQLVDVRDQAVQVGTVAPAKHGQCSWVR